MTDPTAAAALAIVAGDGDATAAATALLLRRRGRVRVHLVTESRLAQARVVHRPSSGPAPHSRVGTTALPGDLLRVSRQIRIGAGPIAIWCRLAAMRGPRLPDESQDYGDAEMSALMLSWLTGLGDRAINPPDPFGLAGRPVDMIKLHLLAQQEGLSTPEVVLRSNEAAWPQPGVEAGQAHRGRWDGLAVPTHASEIGGGYGPPLPGPGGWAEPLTALQTILVVDDQIPVLPGLDGAALSRLVKAAGLRIAEVTLGRPPGGRPWMVAGLSPVPTLPTLQDMASCAAFLERRACRLAQSAA